MVQRMQAMRVSRAEPAAGDEAGADLRVLIPTLALVGLGVAMVFSASIPLAAADGSADVLYYLKRELAVVAVGLCAMWAASRVPMQWVQRQAGTLLVLTVGLLLGVLAFGREINGARSWFVVPGTGLNFQPSEMAKIAIVVASARYFAKFARGIPDWRRALSPLLMLGVIAGLVAIEPDMGTAAVIVAAAFVYYHIAGVKLRHLAGAGAIGAVAAGLLVWGHPYQLQRILDFFGGNEVELAGGYQKARCLIALGSGGVTGCGYCGSVEKYFYLPAATTDSILAVVGEELGLVATWAVVGVFAYLVWRGMTIAGRSRDRFSGLVAAGVTCVIGLQALLNIAVVTGSIPATGVPLPFVSYGGSSLLFSLIGVGLLLNASRDSTGPRG
jgi:cell division protein FtsW